MTEKLSIVAPMYNEQEVIPHFFGTIIPILESLQMDWEIVCVNDGSRDATLEMLRERHRQEPRIKVINLSRNFGKERAMTAGLDYATGDAVIPIDADLQDPPALVVDMVRLWREGYDVVNALRVNRDTDSVLKRTTSLWFYNCINRISDTEVPVNVGDFRLLSRRACDALMRMRESRRFMKGLFAWIGFPTVELPYRREARVAGTTKFKYWKLWNFALEGVVSFSSVPLRVATYIGALFSLLSLAYMIFIVAKTIMFGNSVSGYPSLMAAVLFFGGTNLVFIGIVGEYIARIHDEVKQRPIYLVESALGLEPPALAGVSRRP